jgi:Zn-dependent peptidase ImmA (M78 family)/DNA-binding XRE family transcriptional regulator
MAKHRRTNRRELRRRSTLVSATDPELRNPNLPKRLRNARRDRGLTQEAVADHLGLARTSLVALEKGERAVRADELVAMAHLYQRPVDELLRPTPPVEDFVGQFRTSLSRADDTEALEHAIRRVERYAEDYRELERRAGVTPDHSYPTPYAIDGIPPAAAATEIASTERNRLGLGDGPIPNLRDVLETKIGIRVFFLELPPKVEGFFAFTPETGACVAVNASRPVERQQWTMAHELAHFLTRRSVAEITVAKQPAPTRASQHERFAEAFAGEFTMPSAGITRDFNAIRRTRPDGVTPGALVELAAFYRVSFQALALRLEGLGLLARGTFDVLEHERFSVTEARRLLGLSPPAPDTRVLPVRYVTLAVDAYRDGRISEGAFARFLHLDRVTAREVAQTLARPA